MELGQQRRSRNQRIKLRRSQWTQMWTMRDSRLQCLLTLSGGKRWWRQRERRMNRGMAAPMPSRTNHRGRLTESRMQREGACWTRRLTGWYVSVLFFNHCSVVFHLASNWSLVLLGWRAFHHSIAAKHTEIKQKDYQKWKIPKKRQIIFCFGWKAAEHSE